ncbi:MAG: hypothetical protein IJY22_02000, partial [Clostridia bacterium]|nr:hypothetical protein [Clostridia bacterium]
APQRSGFVQRVENLFGKEQKKSPSGYWDLFLGKLRRMRQKHRSAAGGRCSEVFLAQRHRAMRTKGSSATMPQEGPAKDKKKWGREEEGISSTFPGKIF